MNRPVITYGDNERELISHLTSALAARDEDFLPAEVSTKFPATLTGVTQVQVSHETTPADALPARAFAQTRVTCWASPGQRTQVKQLASLVHGVAQAMPPNAAVGSVRSLIGPSGVTEDPDTKNLAVWFLLRMNLRGNQES